jgi:hypothetical protein
MTDSHAYPPHKYRSASFGPPHKGRGDESPPLPRAANRSEPIPLRQINVTEMLLVVSVMTSDVNETVIGGLQSGLNVAVAVSV